MPLCIPDTWLWHLLEILQSSPDKGESFGHRFSLKHPEAAENCNMATVIIYSLLTKHTNMHSYRFCFAAFPHVGGSADGGCLVYKCSGSSCATWIRQSGKLSDVAHWKSWVFSTIALPTEKESAKVRLNHLGLFPNTREPFNATPVRARRLQQLKVAIIGKRILYEDLFITTNNQEYHFLAKGVYWSQCLYSCH